VSAEPGSQHGGAGVEIGIDLHGRVEALESRRDQHVGSPEESLERTDGTRTEKVDPAGNTQLSRASAVVRNILPQAAHDDQMGCRYPEQGVAEPFEQEPDTLVVFEISDIHCHRAVPIHPGG
jgi:hypothetical protein